MTASERDCAWRRIYDEHFNAVYRLLYRYGVDDVEDLVQRVFEITYTRIQDGESIDNVGAWLRGTAVRVARQHHRWRRVREVHAWLVRWQTEQQHAIDPEQSAAGSESLMLTRRVMQRMSPKLRDVLVLVEIEQCTLSETAEALKIPVNTVRSRRRLARSQFRKLWSCVSTGKEDLDG